MSQDIRVLVGDDDVNDRFFLEWGFKEVCPDISVDFARSGEDVIQCLQDASRPKPSLLILDSMMPRRDGFAVLEWLRARPEFDRLPVVMLSGQPLDKNETRARALCVRSYVGKPHDLDQLKALVQRWKQNYLDPLRPQTSRPRNPQQSHLLVADNNGNFRRFIQKATAEACPHAALTLFRDGVEVLKYFEDNLHSTPRLLLLDLGTTSIETLKWLRRGKGLTELPIIIWTSTPVRVEEELAREFGVTEYLKKPNTFSALLQSFYDFAHRYSPTA